ncbi:hypothetical protein ABPG72_013521 [Tetrahymena utriculariae]
MNSFGVVQKNVLSQYIEGQPSPQQDKKYIPDKFNPDMISVQNFNLYPFSAFGFVEVMPKKPFNKSPQRQSLTSSKSIMQRQSTQFSKSPLRQSIYSRESIIQERDEQEDELEKKVLQEPTLLTGILIGPQHLLVQLDNTEILSNDLKVTIGSYGKVNVVEILRSKFLALNRFVVLLLDRQVGIERGYVGLISNKRTFNNKYFYSLDTIVESDVQTKKTGILVAGFIKNQYHAMQLIYNQVSDVMGGVLINIHVDRNNLSREAENFARNHWPLLVNDPEAGYCVTGFTQEINSKGLKGILINSEQFNQIVIFTQNYQPQDILRIPCCAQLSEDEYKVDVKSIKAHRKSIKSVIRINYRLIASIDSEKKLKIWQIDSKKVYSEIDLSSSPGCIAADNRNIYVCLDDKIQVWNWQLKQITHEIQCFYPITHLIKVNKKYMVAADAGGQIIVWRNNEVNKIVYQPSQQVDQAEVTSMVLFNEKFVAAGFSNGKIITFDISQGVQMRVIENGHFVRGRLNQVNSLVVFNHEYLISGCSDQTVIIWDLSNEYKILKKMKFDGQVLSICPLNEKEMLIAHGCHVTVYNLSSDKTFNLTQIYEPHSELVINCTAIDHEVFSTADVGGTIRLWRVDKVLDEIYETISLEELQKISDQLKDPSNYNYFFFRNFMQFSQIPQLQIQPLSQKEKQLKNEIEQQKLSQQNLMQELQQVYQILKNRESEIQQKTSQIERLTGEIDSLNSKQYQKNNRQSEQADQIQKLQQQVRDLTSNESKLVKELEQLRKKNQVYQEENIQQSKSKERLTYISSNGKNQQNIDQLQKQLNQLSSTIAKLENENDRLKKEFNSNEQQVRQFQQSPSKAYNNKSQNDQYLNNLEMENNKLRSQIRTLEQEQQQSRLSNEINQREVYKSPIKTQRVSQNIVPKSPIIDPKEEEINRLKQEILEQASQNKLLIQQLESYRLDLIEKNNEIEEMKNSVQSLKDSFNEIQNLQQKKHKLDVKQKEKEKEEILQILNDQRQQNQKLMKTLEITREQHIKNLQESNKERRQMLENQNVQSNIPFFSSSSNQYTNNDQIRNNSFNSRVNYQQEPTLSNNQENLNNWQSPQDIQNCKKELQMVQDQIQSLKISILNSSNSQSDLQQSSQKNVNPQKYNESQREKQNNDLYERTAQKKQGGFLDANISTPIQNKKSVSPNKVSSPQKDRNTSYQPQQSFTKNKAELQQILQNKLSDLQQELLRRQGKIDSQGQNLNQQERGRSPNASMSPQRFKQVNISQSPQPKQNMYNQGSMNNSVIITGNKSLGDFIGSPLKVNKCNIEIDIGIDQNQQDIDEKYSSPQKQNNQFGYPQVQILLANDQQNKQKNKF